MIYKTLNEFVQSINEGLITTHNIEKAKSITLRWYEEMFDVVDFKIIDNDTYELHVKDDISYKVFDILISDINNYGYFPSIIYLENEKGMINRFKYNYDIIRRIILGKRIISIKIICEKKFDDVIKVPEIIYHVCREENYEKIMKIGLCPKSKNRTGSHPERIYFCLDLDSCKKLVDKFQFNDKLNKNISEQSYFILEIFTKNLNHITFRKDPNMINGCYTDENIHPNNVKKF